jgi:CHASE1-domain containing sensor protein
MYNMMSYSQLCFDVSGHLEKKRHYNTKKLVGIIVGLALLVVGMTIVGLVLWKKKLRNQGRFIMRNGL